MPKWDTKMTDYKSLGKRIKDIRLSKKITQKELAHNANITDRYMSNIETGKCKTSIETVISIVNALGVSLDNVFYDSLDNVSTNNTVNSKTVYDKEVKELLKDLNNEELKLIIEIIKFNKEAIKKVKEIKYKK